MMSSRTEKRWLLSVSVFLAALCAFFLGNRLLSSVNAQPEPQTRSENGIMVVPIQIDRDSYGIAMVDTTAQTLWVYELNNRAPGQNRLRLLAARSWKYDRLLDKYNTAEPKPEQVKMILESVGRMPKTQNQPQPDEGIKTAEPEKRTPDSGG